MSSSSSIVSKFQFESYKVDSFSFNMSKSINVLLYKGAFLEKDWKFNFSLVKPVLFKDSQKYLSGIKCNIVLQPAEGEKLLELNASISGLFSIE
ncbi:MAG: hypothetical protein PF518_10910, partial [Spirochaetaceae bacterium]|nr:hypothetical protein [Spirochaetaceae bacterium]